MTRSQQDNTDRRLYHDLAWIWPIISPPSDYRGEAEEFHDLIQANGAGDLRRLLHLGCGAGHLDSHLKQHYQITGVDLSETMLAMARQLNPEATYLQGDIQTIQLENEFDIVILADASDYLLSRDALSQVFSTAYNHLRPGGLFCTYAEETTELFEQNKTKASRHSKEGIEIVAVENVYDPNPADNTYELTFVYLIRNHGALKIEMDRHQAGLFSTSTWINTLEATGFSGEVIHYKDSGPMFIGLKVPHPEMFG